MFNFTQHSIKSFPFEDYSKVPLEEINELSQFHQLWRYQDWMLPQLWSYFGNWQVKEPKWKLVGQQNIQTHWDQGAWRVVTKLNRGEICKPQNKNSKYGALTPFILAAIREHQGIAYSSWDIDPNFQLIDQNLLDSMLKPAVRPSREELLEVRKNSLVYRSGARRGQQKNPESVWSVGDLHGTPLWGSTNLQKVMLLQLWLAHPAVRHPVMVLDPEHWDEVPQPLVDLEVVTHTIVKPQLNNSLPWLVE